MSLDAFNDMKADWGGRARGLAGEREALTARARRLDGELGRLAEMRELWERSRDAARESDAPPAVVGRAQAVVESVDAARAELQQRRGSVLTLQNRVAQLEALVADVIGRIEAARSEERGRLLVRDAPPFWEAFGDRAPQGTLPERMRASLRDQLEALRDYAPGHRATFAAHLAVFAITLLTALALRPRAEAWLRQEEEAEASARVLRRPVSAAVVVALLALPWLYPNAPSVVGDVAVLAAVAPILRLLPARLAPGLKPAVYAVVALFVLDQLRDLLDALPLVERCLLAVESLAGVAFLARLLRRGEVPRTGGWLRGVHASLRAGLLLFGAALVANLLGNLNLARLLVTATLSTYLIAAILYTASQILDGLVAVVLRTGFARRLRMVRNHGPLLRRRGLALVHTGMLVLWGWLALGQFALQELFTGGVRAAIDASIPLGAVQIAFGDVLLFGLTLWGTFLFSRLVRFGLDEDVMPRLSLPRGVPYAVSYILHYGILLLGFVLAVAAAGFDLGRFALLAGALGVGIGFGLQNVVNNFISGLILLFERPVQVGDTIQVGELMGEVRRIGIRSSTVRTWQGAEVIVPNAGLISEQVVNWTLSDRERRIEVNVGVAYGTDPQRVLALLLEVAAKHPDLLSHPAPSALFQGFGESSLDFELRGWTGNAGEWMRIRSDLAVAINAALAEAGIEIPFPQRDLHVRSIAPKLAALAPGSGEER